MSDDRKLLEDCLAVAKATERELRKTFPDFDLPLVRQLQDKLKEMHDVHQ
jgi:hypothetical protein